LFLNRKRLNNNIILDREKQADKSAKTQNNSIQDKKRDKRNNFPENFVKETQEIIIAAKENNFITDSKHQGNLK
jgi:uncharacterized protein YdaU (DUF1376 family)